MTNKTLRNLDEQSISKLTEYYNHCLEEGEIPQQWKAAKVIFIPKPNKPIHIDNFRPISLTSCIGKILEHVIHLRLSKYIEHNHLFPSEMTGFRKSLSCQDVMLRLKEDIIEPSDARDTQALLGLDLKGAFNNVSHLAILRELSSINCGERIYRYIRSFLTKRTATLQLGSEQSGQISLGSTGTPQGAVLSPSSSIWLCDL